MEPLRQSRHRHHRHHGHHDSNHRSRKVLESLAQAQEPKGTVSHRHQHATTPDPTSYVESWLQNAQPPDLLSDIPPIINERLSNDMKKSRRRGRRRSRDSSIIAPAVPDPRHTPHGRDARKLSEILDPSQITQKAAHKKRPRLSPSTAPGYDERVEEQKEEDRRYEKRARHKTRADKYEPNHGGRARRKHVEHAPKVKERKPNDKRKMKKSALTTASDLMDKFSSHAIHNDRLTIKPSMQAGIFRNSKAGKAPGDLSFGGEMGFLKETEPQELPKAVPKLRTRDQAKSQREVEDIEVFFSHHKPVVQKPPRTTGMAQDQHSPGVPPPRDDTHPTKTRSSRAGVTSRATTYISWSPSIRSVTRPQAQPNDSPPDAESPVSSPRSRKHSSTPNDIRQALLDTGIYRAITEQKQHLPESLEDMREGGLGERETADTRPRSPKIVDSPDVPESRKEIARQAYVRRGDALRQFAEEPLQSQRRDSPYLRSSIPANAVLREHPQSQEKFAHQAYMRRRDAQELHGGPPRPRPPDKLGSMYDGAAREAENVPAYASYDGSRRYMPFNRSQAWWDLPVAPPMLSSNHSGTSSQYRSPAAMAPPPKPISRFTYAGHLKPRSTTQPQSTSSLTGLDARMSLLNSSRGPLDRSSYEHPSPRLLYPEESMPELPASQTGVSPPQARQESMHDYVDIDHAEPDVPRVEYKNHPPAAPMARDQVVREGPFSTPFFRHGPTAGSMPAYQARANTANFWTLQSDRQSVRLENSPVSTVPQDIPGHNGSLADGRDGSLENHGPRTRWTMGISSEGGADPARYWPLNTYGLL
ncbi:hypothetical protein GE09DRAFT_1084337 [Coniochaeta sp. 2T2.1]|nr:hypothetical protein GE09DRAFT_1084337 [Coniochaeta sp. 2T2.1]